jgi:hypothetical protein
VVDEVVAALGTPEGLTTSALGPRRASQRLHWKYKRLWNLGMHPAHVDEVTRRFRSDEFLPLDFYIAVTGGQADPEMLGRPEWGRRGSREDFLWFAWVGRNWPDHDPRGPKAA